MFAFPCASFTNEIIVLDDVSTDMTVPTIQIHSHKECNVTEIIRKKEWYRDEPGDRNILLNAGRAHGGTHFIVIDADEMFTSNCLDNSFEINNINAATWGYFDIQLDSAMEKC